MCLGIPMKILAIEQFMARCEAKGVERDVSLFMLQDEPAKVGDYVVVHVGYAIQKMTEPEALTAWQIYDEMLALEQQAQVQQAQEQQTQQASQNSEQDNA
ncbi:MAG: HypC/HybG/HupF family hydrogenase formation chaperone [Gammaproteobacteria bacterium]|nr:HypC/HybG/HupF family hydrogenase formation chaperone [Gammaproteobacteria bacterium]